MNQRFELEKYFNIYSPTKKLLDDFELRLTDLARHSDGIVSMESVKQFLEDDNRVLVDDKLRSLKNLSGKFDVIVTETNDIEFREDIYDIRVEDKQDQEINFYMRSKFRRIVQKKGYDSDNYDNADEGDIGKAGSGLIGGAPYLWIKLDPYNNYLRQIVVRDGENILLAQLDKDLKEMLDLSNIFRILESLVYAGTDAAVNKLCDTLLRNKVSNENLKIQMVDTLTKIKIRSSESKIIDTLVKLIKNLKFDNDKSLKENDFDEQTQPYNLINFLISELSIYERKCMAETIEESMNKPQKFSASYTRIKINPQTNEHVVNTLLTLLQKNDNSQNPYNDIFYQSNLLRSLFRCLNLANFSSVVKEVNRFLKIEFFTQYEQKHLIKTIFEDYITFWSKHQEFNPSLKSEEEKTSIEYLEKLAQRHQCDIILAKSVFKMELLQRKKSQHFKTPFDLLIWAMQYVEDIRSRANNAVTHSILSDLVNYV